MGKLLNISLKLFQYNLFFSGIFSWNESFFQVFCWNKIIVKTNGQQRKRENSFVLWKASELTDDKTVFFHKTANNINFLSSLLSRVAIWSFVSFLRQKKLSLKMRLSFVLFVFLSFRACFLCNLNSNFCIFEFFPQFFIFEIT